MGVIPGRNGHFKGTISNDDIIKLLGDFPGRFVGTAGLNASKREEAIDEIERTVLNGPPQGREHGTRRAGQAHVCRRSPYLSHL